VGETRVCIDACVCVRDHNCTHGANHELHAVRRQGRAFFMGLRQTQKLQSEGKYEEVKPKIVEGHAWVSVTLPNGEYRQLLVDENRRVLSKRPMSAHI
jgi:hypothetical protein